MGGTEADAFSALLPHHARGDVDALEAGAGFGQMFYQLGDCGFAAAGHHGTPNQRMRVRLLGRSAWRTRPARRDTSFRPADFIELFAAQYPQLVAPDATTASSRDSCAGRPLTRPRAPYAARFFQVRRPSAASGTRFGPTAATPLCLRLSLELRLPRVRVPIV